MSSIYNIAKLSNKDFKKLVSEYISLEDIYDECKQCRRPVNLHQELGEECTRDSDEGLEVRAKLLLKDIKEEITKKKEQNVYLEGIERIVNTLKMSIDTSGDSKVTKSDSTVSNKPRLQNKQGKVSVWTKDLTLETYIKQIQS